MKTQTLTIISTIFILLSLATIQALVINSVSMTPNEVAPGETASIRIGIENDGNDDIEDVSVVLDLSGIIESGIPGMAPVIIDMPFAPYDSSSEYSFDEIDEDDTEYAKFKIIALSNAQSGIYKIPLTITYTEDEMIKTKRSLIGVTVNSEPIIGVSVEDDLLLKGQENEIMIKIVNKGLSDVRFLEIELGSSTYLDLLSQENIYIGDIDSDDFDSAEFRIYFKDKVPSTVNIPVNVVYKDAVNNEYSEEFTIDLKVYTREEAIEIGLLEKSNTRTYVISVIVLVVLYFGYKKWKKYRKMKKAAAKEGVGEEVY